MTKFPLSLVSDQALLITGALQGEIRAGCAQACRLENKCERCTDCLLPNWKRSVGFTGMVSFLGRRRKKKKEKKRKGTESEKT